MIPSDFINRIYEYDRATGLTLTFMSACIESSLSEKISPDEIASMYEKLYPLGKKIAYQIDAGEYDRNKKSQKDNTISCVGINSVATAYPVSKPFMRSTPK